MREKLIKWNEVMWGYFEFPSPWKLALWWKIDIRWAFATEWEESRYYKPEYPQTVAIASSKVLKVTKF